MVLGHRRDDAPVGHAPLSVYGRPDAYYLVRHAQTTSGVWLLDGSPAVVGPLSATSEVLGDAVWKVAAPEARRIPHRSQQDWTRDGKERSTALFAQAGVRSWKSFERGSALASVERDGETAIVMALVRDNDRPDAWF
jgi:hypothetical protein